MAATIPLRPVASQRPQDIGRVAGGSAADIVGRLHQKDGALAGAEVVNPGQNVLKAGLGGVAIGQMRLEQIGQLVQMGPRAIGIARCGGIQAEAAIGDVGIGITRHDVDPDDIGILGLDLARPVKDRAHRVGRPSPRRWAAAHGAWGDAPAARRGA